MAAGGGSRLFFRSGMFVVGPESAGANPGPTCYGKGERERMKKRERMEREEMSFVLCCRWSFDSD